MSVSLMNANIGEEYSILHDMHGVIISADGLVVPVGSTSATIIAKDAFKIYLGWSTKVHNIIPNGAVPNPFSSQNILKSFISMSGFVIHNIQDYDKVMDVAYSFYAEQKLPSLKTISASNISPLTIKPLQGFTLSTQAHKVSYNKSYTSHGHKCFKCHEFNQYAEHDVTKGNFICYSCKRR